MKKHLIFPLFWIVIHTQVYFSQSLIGGFVGYANSSCFESWSDASNPHAQANFTTNQSYLFGINYKDRLNKSCNLAMSILYQQCSLSGSSANGGMGAGYGSQTSLQYSTLFLKIVPDFRLGSKTGFHIGVGPYFQFIPTTKYSSSNSSWQMQLQPPYYPLTSTNYSSGKSHNNLLGLSMGWCINFSFQAPISKRLKFISEWNLYRGLTCIPAPEIVVGIKSTTMCINAGIVYILPNFSIGKQLDGFWAKNKNLPQNIDQNP